MSAVRMCDQCGTIFSERADGWTTMLAARVKRVNGRPQTAEEQLDLCPPCSGQVESVTPRLAIVRDPAPGESPRKETH